MSDESLAETRNLRLENAYLRQQLAGQFNNQNTFLAGREFRRSGDRIQRDYFGEHKTGNL